MKTVTELFGKVRLGMMYLEIATGCKFRLRRLTDPQDPTKFQLYLYHVDTKTEVYKTTKKEWKCLNTLSKD